MIATTIITSFVTTFFIGRLYLNLQYLQSNAGHRQKRIIEATKSIFKINLNDKERYQISAAYHTSLGPVLYKLITFKSNNGAYILPSLNGIEKEGWKFYDLYVRPVSNDLNNNAFIGWLPYFRNVERLKILWKFCKKIEDIVTMVEVLKINNKIAVKEDFITILSEYKKDADVEKLISTYQDLFHLVNKWCKIIKVKTEVFQENLILKNVYHDNKI